MKLSIDTDVLSKYNLNLGEFLVMLMGFYEFNYKECYERLCATKLIGPNIFISTGVVLSENTEKLIEKILLESDDKLKSCGIEDFEKLAEKLQEIYPSGTKAGTTYDWRGTTEEIAFKLKALVVLHNFKFTEEEAINATKEYVNSFNDYKYMSLLKYFLLKTYEDEKGHREIDSMFITIIENNRENK